MFDRLPLLLPSYSLAEILRTAVTAQRNKESHTNMESIYTLLCSQFARSSRKVHEKKNVLLAHRKEIEKICLSEPGTLYLIQGECPETSDICVAIALEAVEKGYQVNYVTDRVNPRDVATMVVSQKLSISIERIANGNLDIMERKWIDKLVQKYSDASFSIGEVLRHSDAKVLLSIKEDIEEVERLGRLTRGSLLILDWLGTWDWDSVNDTITPEALEDIEHVIEHMNKVATDNEIIVVIGCYLNKRAQANAMDAIEPSVVISESFPSAKEKKPLGLDQECVAANDVPDCDARSLVETNNDGITSWMKRRANLLHENSLGYQMKERLDKLTDEYQKQDKTYRFALVGGDHGCPGGFWTIYCNGWKLLQINDGYAIRALKNNAMLFDRRIRKQIDRLKIAHISEKERTFVDKIENDFNDLHNHLKLKLEDEVVFENAWKIFEAELKTSDAY